MRAKQPHKRTHLFLATGEQRTLFPDIGVIAILNRKKKVQEPF